MQCGEVDTVLVSEINPFKIEKKYKNIRKKIIKEKYETGLEPETNRASEHDLHN